MDYRKKYLEYKAKYIDLKNQLKGGTQDDKRLEQKDAGYVKAQPAIRCGTCKFFRSTGRHVDIENIPKESTLGECHIVKGTIHEYGCCNLWTPLGGTLSTNFKCGKDIDIEDLMK